MIKNILYLIILLPFTALAQPQPPAGYSALRDSVPFAPRDIMVKNSITIPNRAVNDSNLNGANTAFVAASSSVLARRISAIYNLSTLDGNNNPTTSFITPVAAPSMTSTGNINAAGSAVIGGGAYLTGGLIASSFNISQTAPNQHGGWIRGASGQSVDLLHFFSNSYGDLAGIKYDGGAYFPNLQVTGLAGTGSAIVQTDASGNVSRLGYTPESISNKATS